MKDYSKFNDFDYLIREFMTKVIDEAYKQGYEDCKAEEKSLGENIDVEKAFEELTDALLNRDYMKANYGTINWLDVIRDFKCSQIIKEYQDWVNRTTKCDDCYYSPKKGFHGGSEECRECCYGIKDHHITKADYEKTHSIFNTVEWKKIEDDIRELKGLGYTTDQIVKMIKQVQKELKEVQ